ncbi:hypothetical protein [Anaplasma phagocytophilum]|nr:hypothetical protein [Anaplasma phagocytophilum]SBO30947.1 hypothetical protein ANAPC2_00463 [Anaplasma phagocytophilum]SBO32467.1 hypothetical protein ANAPC3_00875 [Anaplasma phagocytophilum]SBO32508.1 hypothetical protein ANAPC4_00836 [Anaplasma phagocytophilum]SCV65520.1 hypothetical protein ANAPC5_01174 [Anaplasma phagocytophilum]
MDVRNLVALHMGNTDECALKAGNQIQALRLLFKVGILEYSAKEVELTAK